MRDLLISEMEGLLREVKGAHTQAEKFLPAHDWVEWYAAYMVARFSGSSSGESYIVANNYLKEEEKIGG